MYLHRVPDIYPGYVIEIQIAVEEKEGKGGFIEQGKAFLAASLDTSASVCSRCVAIKNSDLQPGSDIMKIGQSFLERRPLFVLPVTLCTVNEEFAISRDGS